ncbi:MAG: thiosulfate oxidation carrier protein SoxY [Alphaproteobacteria bacterium]|nr:thiosulfate oxidation carrier protein SoxY [Alphaproteobacteria bacterium]
MSVIPIHQGLSRRRFLSLGAGCALVSLLPVSALATEEEMESAVKELFGDRPLEKGGVSIDIPPLAENGYSVPLTIDVDSPMTEADHVTRIAVFSPRNPLPEIIQFKLGPRAGLARVSTRIRLAGSQTILVVAEMSDGTLRSASAETMVTVAACVIG